ncbi:MAG: hypothetical protein Q8K92_27120, partial [Leadbetterella sp.]|nr:hypothetical protein [Leadbetterella sp.]
MAAGACLSKNAGARLLPCVYYSVGCADKPILFSFAEQYLKYAILFRLSAEPTQIVDTRLKPCASGENSCPNFERSTQQAIFDL